MCVGVLKNEIDVMYKSCMLVVASAKFIDWI